MQNNKGRSNSSFLNIIKKNKLNIIILLVIIVYLLLNKLFGIHIDCIFNKITGLYCPGCGLTRMFKSILILDFYQAFRYNPLIFIYLLIYIIYNITKIIKKLLRKEQRKNKKIPDKFWYIVLVVTILYGVLRNIPMFSYLGPIEI